MGRFRICDLRAVPPLRPVPVQRQQHREEQGEVHRWAIKGYIRQNLGDRPFNVLHHSSGVHPGLQAADYCMWAVYRKWQSGDLRSYRLIEPFIRSEYDIFQNGRERFY